MAQSGAGFVPLVGSLGVSVEGSLVLRIPAREPRAGSCVWRDRAVVAPRAQENFVEQSILPSHCWRSRKAGACPGGPVALDPDIPPGPPPLATRLPPSSRTMMVPKSAMQLTHHV